MSTALSVSGQVLVVFGALLFTTAGVGLLRLRDAYARSSAIATAAGLGMSLVLTGAFLLQPGGWTTLKLAVAVVLQLATSAVGSMALARSAYLTGSPMHLAGTQGDRDDHRDNHRDDRRDDHRDDHPDDDLARDGRAGGPPAPDTHGNSAEGS